MKSLCHWQVLVFFSMVFGVSNLAIHVLDIASQLRQLSRAQERALTLKSVVGDVLSILSLDPRLDSRH